MEAVKYASTRPVPVEAPNLIDPITATDKRLRGMIALWGIERKTLRLFPGGAFAACDSAGHLLMAATSDGTVHGYPGGTFR